MTLKAIDLDALLDSSLFQFSLNHFFINGISIDLSRNF